MDPEERKRRLIIGSIVTAVLLVVFVVLFTVGRNKHGWGEKVVLRADFKTVGGLRIGSPVQVAGVTVGRVDTIDFARVTYQCEPLTEDIGRYGAGRTDDCDDFLFCTPVGLCGDLETWSGRGDYGACITNEDCQSDEICVSSELQRRARRVEWSGPNGVCAKFITEHWRTQVKMEVLGDAVEQMVRIDSRAMVSANSVLGDQLVNISTGVGHELGEDGRIQIAPSLFEDIARLRVRIESFTEKADISLEAIEFFINELRDEKTIAALKGTLRHLEVISRKLAYAEGLLGALFSSPDYKRDAGLTLGALRSTSSGLETTVGTANSILAQVDSNMEPLVGDARRAVQGVDNLLVDLDDPKNRSLAAKILRDPDGKLATHLENVLANARSISGSANAITGAVERGDGTLGRLVNDPYVRDVVGRLLHNLATHGVLRALALWFLDDTLYKESVRDPAAPR